LRGGRVSNGDKDNSETKKHPMWHGRPGLAIVSALVLATCGGGTHGLPVNWSS
jgi:hypothetical protein